MSWKNEIDELKKREKLSEEMGGAEKLKKQVLRWFYCKWKQCWSR